MRLTGASLAFLVLALFALSTEAFTSSGVKGSSTTRARPASSTELNAVAKKKKKAAKKKAAKKSDVETLRKADMVAEIAERMGSTKSDADAALTAVMDTISDVSREETCIKYSAGSSVRTD